MSKPSKAVWITVLCLAWGFDFLFWRKPPGISFPIFTLLCLAVGLYLARREGLRPARTSLSLVLLVILFSLLTLFRQEPLTLLTNSMLAIFLMAILAQTFLGGRWLAYSFVDYAWGFLRLGFSAISAGLDQWIQERKNPELQPAAEPSTSAGSVALRQHTIPVLRGILLASPVLALFAFLLASADPVFSLGLNNFLSLFRIQNLPEYLFRLFYILILAYLLAGVFLHALTHSKDERLIGLENSRFASFLGLTEAVIVLGSVDLLFTSFVGVQFRYFFGGHANISIEGFTYSEYARRGFGELVAVAFFSLLLFWGLSMIARKEPSGQRRLFAGLGIALVILVAIILASAFQRMLLYEQAYGFTRLRAYTHVFMIWLGILLAVVAMLELSKQLRLFAGAVLFAAIGFVLSLTLLNVDGFIARQNISRAQAGQPLDITYLTSLSADAVPILVELGASPALPAPVRFQVRVSLACQAAAIESQKNKAWQSFQLPVYQAQRALNQHLEEWQSYPTNLNEFGRWVVKVDGKEQFCDEPVPE